MVDPAGKTARLVSALKKRKVLVVLGVLLIGAAVFWLWRSQAAKNETYLAESVVKGDVVNAITASGTVEAENTVPLIFKNSAVIKGIYVKEGQRVKKGDLLAEQDDSDLTAQYEQQLANLKSAEIKLSLARNGARPEEVRQAEENVNIAAVSYEQARVNFERYRVLAGQGVVSQSDKEKVENEYKLSEAKLNQAREQLNILKAGSRPEDIALAEVQVDVARAQLKTSRNNLDSARMVAPDDGYIGQIGAVVGQRTNGAGSASSSEDGFITLISDRLRVRTQVNEADIGRAAVGQKAVFTVNSFPDRKFRGSVESISPKAITVSNVQLYEVIIVLEQQETSLKVGMPANVTIVVEQKAGVTLLPKIAVSFATKNAAKFMEAQAPDGSRAGSGRAAAGGERAGSSGQGTGLRDSRPEGGAKVVPVLVMENGKPVLRRVQVGISDNTNYEVTGGLKEGEQVVIGSATQPGSTARPGSGQQALPFGGAPRIRN